jgi:hypothetical protein
MNFIQQATIEAPRTLTPQHNPEAQLPLIPSDILDISRDLGWVGVGIMVALVTVNEEVLLLKGRETLKYREGTLGPLGETTKQSDGINGIPPIVEQPLQTLFRGIKEELGVSEPATLGLKMQTVGAWAINQWPRGDSYPNQWNCAISFVVHVPPKSASLLRTIDPHNDEVMGLVGRQVDDVLADNPDNYRLGTQNWLAQLKHTNLLSSAACDLRTIDFSSVFLGDHDVQVDE